MLLEITSPDSIYTVTLNEVDKLLQAFKEPAEDDEEIKIARQEAHGQLTASREEIQNSLAQLQRNSEWDVFTIAFYGETNAGKSTLIETLRILLKEPEKTREQQEFTRLYGEYSKVQCAIEECQASINTITDEYENNISDIDAQFQAISREKQGIEHELGQVRPRIQTVSGEKQGIEHELGQVRPWLQAVSGEKQGIEQTLAQVKPQLQAVSGEKQDIGHELAQVRSQLQTLPDEKRAIDAEITRIQEEINILNTRAAIERKQSIGSFIRYLFKRLPAQKAAKENNEEMIKKGLLLQDTVRRENEFSQRERGLTQREGELIQRVNELTQAVGDLTQRQNESAQRENELTQRESELTRKQSEITRMQNELMQRESELMKRNSELTQRENELTQLKKDLERKWQNRIRELKNTQNRLAAESKTYSAQMAETVDGRIIGDGRSDFTRTVSSYAFEANNQKFALLDLPGIEGNEGPVLDAINTAVQKAHAVFYVTGKPAPPQTGDTGEGTLEKIKKHLGEQTEVFTVFNKRVKNPMALKEPLTDGDEDASLRDLDRVMSKHLGEQYLRCISLSAYPAFLSVANCWQNDYEAKKKKFLEYFTSPQTLLEKTGLRKLTTLLTSDIVHNCKAKIKKANYKKAAAALTDTAKGIKQIHKRFSELEEKLIETKKTADKQLDNEASSLKARLNSETHTAIENFENTLRKDIYADIETEINNDGFKTQLKSRTDENVKSLQSDIESRFSSAIDGFKNNVSGIIKNFERYAAELLSVYTSAGQFDAKFELKNVDIKSGVNWAGALTSVIGSVVRVILCITNPVGWVKLALSLIGGLISIGKAIAGFFNHNYRKSQQKKAADENIKNTGEQILKSIEQNIAETYTPLESGVQNIKNDLAKSVSHVKTINDILVAAESRFGEMAKTIKKEGER